MLFSFPTIVYLESNRMSLFIVKYIFIFSNLLFYLPPYSKAVLFSNSDQGIVFMTINCIKFIILLIGKKVPIEKIPNFCVCIKTQMAE
jgi:hypothetical protein